MRINYFMKRRKRTFLQNKQEKECREAAIASATGIPILAAVTPAVPVRLMKRDLLFVVERLANFWTKGVNPGDRTVGPG